MSDLQERADRIIAVSPALAREIAKRFRIEPIGLTKRQTETLEFIRTFQADHDGVSPTFREMADALGVTIAAAFKLAHRLEERGRIRMFPNHSRSIVLVEDQAA